MNDNDKKYKYTWGEVAVTILMLILMAFVAVSCGEYVPDAAKAETDNQRHIAAKGYIYHGYNQYMKFAERNK